MKSACCDKEFVERIKQALELVPGENVDAKAKALATTNASLYSYMNGKSLPQMPFLMNLRELTGINIDWLVSGEGDFRRVAKNEINLGYIQMIEDKLTRLLALINESLSNSEFVGIVLQIYNILLFEKFEEKDISDVIDKILPLCFVRKTNKTIESDEVVSPPARYNSLVHGDEAEFFEKYPNGIIEYNVEDQLQDMLDSMDAYIESILKDISDDELTRERVKSVIQAVLEHFEIGRQKSA